MIEKLLLNNNVQQPIRKKINEMIDYLNDNESGHCNDDIIKTYIMELKQTISSLKKMLHEKSTIPKLCTMLESYEETQRKLKRTIIIKLVPEEGSGCCDGCFYENDQSYDCTERKECENGYIWKVVKSC